MQAIVPTLPSLPIQPLIRAGNCPHGMFKDFRAYPWVMNVVEYDPATLDDIVGQLVEACEFRVKEGQ